MAPDVIHMTGRRRPIEEVGLAVREFGRSLASYRLWGALALHDVLGRYRGSLLGPLWITLATSSLIVGMGLLYSQLFESPMDEYIPYLAASIVIWGFLSSAIVESCDAFTGSSTLVKQTPLPMLVFVWRTLWRALLIFAHQLPVIAVVMLYFNRFLDINFPLALVGILLIGLNLAWIAIVLSIVAARFRDVPQVVISLMQVAMFLTPVFWSAEGIRSGRFILDANPFWHLLEVGRAPWLGQIPDMHHYVVATAILLGGWAFAAILYTVVQRRIVHYV